MAIDIRNTKTAVETSPAAETLKTIATELVNEKPNLVDAINKIHDPIKKIVDHLNVIERSSDNLHHSNQQLGQLNKAIERIATGDFKIDSRIGILGKSSDYINQADKITNRLSNELVLLRDNEDLPEGLKTAGVTVQSLRDNLSEVAGRIKDSGLKEAGIKALHEAKKQRIA